MHITNYFSFKNSMSNTNNNYVMNININVTRKCIIEFSKYLKLL